MAAQEWLALADLANNLTVAFLLLLAVVAFAKGWVVTAGRLQDWVERVRQLEAQNAEQQKLLLSFTAELDKMTDLIGQFRATLEAVARDLERRRSR